MRLEKDNLQAGIQKILDLALRSQMNDSSWVKGLGEIYQPPETFGPELSEISPQGAVYTLGVIMWEILTGQKPWSEHFESGKTKDFIIRSLW